MKQFYEQLEPDSLLEMLKSRREKLFALLELKNKVLEKAPEGRLRISVNKGVLQYYRVTEKYCNGTYLKKKDLGIAKAIAQKEYNQKIAEILGRQLTLLDEGIKSLEKLDLNLVYERLPEEKRCLVEPVTLSDEEYALRWQSEEYKPKPFADEAPELYTAKGERVRSKSEVIIADTLNRLGIPYRYEFPVSLKRFDVYPDFYCLNVRTRKEFIWEHFGMMSDCDYAASVVEKFNAYGEKNWLPGKNLLFTMESEVRPVSSKMIEQMILEFLV